MQHSTESTHTRARFRRPRPITFTMSAPLAGGRGSHNLRDGALFLDRQPVRTLEGALARLSMDTLASLCEDLMTLGNVGDETARDLFIRLECLMNQAADREKARRRIGSPGCILYLVFRIPAADSSGEAPAYRYGIRSEKSIDGFGPTSLDPEVNDALAKRALTASWIADRARKALARSPRPSGISIDLCGDRPRVISVIDED